MFKLAFMVTNTPKRRFYCIEQCHDIAIIGQTLYAQVQLIANAVHLFLVLSMFSMKQLKNWKNHCHENFRPSRHLCMARMANVSFLSSCAIRLGSGGTPRPRICMQLWPTGLRIQMTINNCDDHADCSCCDNGQHDGRHIQFNPSTQ